MREFNSRHAGLAVLGLGIALSLVAAWLVASDLGYRARAVVAGGEIDWVGSGDFAYRFGTADGRDVRVRAGHACLGECRPGAVVDVLYDPRRPALARVRDEPGRWLMPGVAGVLGLLATGFGLVFAWASPGPPQYRTEAGVDEVRPGRDPEGRFYVVHASWTDPASGETHRFASPKLREDPERHIAARGGSVPLSLVPDAAGWRGGLDLRALGRPPLPRGLIWGSRAPGLILLLLSALYAGGEIAFRLRAETAEALVVDVAESFGTVRNDPTNAPRQQSLSRVVRYLHPVFEFTTPDGTLWRVTGGGWEVPELIVGDSEIVRYDPRDPATARLPGPGGFLGALGCAVFGIALYLGAVGFCRAIGPGR